MPLGDTGPFREWVERDDPSYEVGRRVEDWISLAGRRPYAAPSIPMDGLCDESRQVRFATVPRTSVEVFYSETYSSGMVDLIWVRTLPG